MDGIRRATDHSERSGGAAGRREEEERGFPFSRCIFLFSTLITFMSSFLCTRITWAVKWIIIVCFLYNKKKIPCRCYIKILIKKSNHLNLAKLQQKKVGGVIQKIFTGHYDVPDTAPGANR